MESKKYIKSDFDTIKYFLAKDDRDIKCVKGEHTGTLPPGCLPELDVTKE